MDTSASAEAGSEISQRRWIPVHAAIYCQEILCHIFSYFAYVPRARRRRMFGLSTVTLRAHHGTLPRLARTCKAFSEPALDVLWKRMEELLPFVRILSDVEEADAGPYGFPAYGEITEAAWNRFLMYTGLVRELCLHPCMGEQISDGLMRDLQGRLEGRPLFPRLQLFQSLDVYQNGLGKQSALLYPGLRVLSLSMSDEITQLTAEIVPRVLETVHTVAPDLTTLILAADEGQDIDLKLDILTAIVLFRGLRQLHFDGTSYLNYASLAQLTNLECLERLSASLNLDDVPPSQMVCFPPVHDATLRGSSNHLAAFFAHFAMPSLQTLAINVTTHDLRVSLRSAMADIFGRVPRTLTTLHLIDLKQDWMRGARTPNPGAQALTLVQILQPLLLFRLLRTVQIDFMCLPPIDDDCIKSMLEAWPDLTHLIIYPGISYTAEERRLPTTKSLVLAATTYPKLEQLHLPLIDISNSAQMLAQHQSFPGHPLKSISLKPNCEKDDHYSISKVALLIDRLFPHLVFPMKSAQNHDHSWYALKKHLMCMSAGRKHARLMELLEFGRIISVCMCGTAKSIDMVPHVRVPVNNSCPVAYYRHHRRFTYQTRRSRFQALKACRFKRVVQGRLYRLERVNPNMYTI
ncbi:hypothetical protein C8Q73DRAFT_767165 [Cubamyces lactineus]|nr:hypothetical protein C8Q73DRAFT_767165 [Cubamyces lactineus]